VIGIGTLVVINFTITEELQIVCPKRRNIEFYMDLSLKFCIWPRTAGPWHFSLQMRISLAIIAEYSSGSFKGSRMVECIMLLEIIILMELVVQ
jgi:hypothetical protein